MGDYGFEGAGDFAGTDFPYFYSDDSVPKAKNKKMSIIDYDILTALYTSDLRDAVRDAINEGWLPLGGVAIADRTYAQAIVKVSAGTKELNDKKE